MQPRTKVFRAFMLTATVSLVVPLGVSAQQDTFEIGGDVFVSGNQQEVDASRDAFAVGPSTSLSGQVGQDAHAVGFSVEVDADTGGDLYVAGGSVSVRGQVGSDLTATGGTVRTHDESTTSGNARLTGGTVNIDGPVDGALIASGGEVVLNAPIGGDAMISAPRIMFGPNATVAGQLTYSTRETMDIPESVAPSERVTFRELEVSDAFRASEESWEWPGGPDIEIGPGAVVGAIAVSVGSFLLVGSVFLAFAPNLVSSMRKMIVARPGKTSLAGLIGLSMLFGSIPILAFTIIGIPLVPIAIFVTLAAWFLSYVLGSYSIGMGVARSLGMADDPGIPLRLVILASAACVAALLNFIPILGWMVNFAIVILGAGAITHHLFERIIPRSEAPDSAYA